MGAQSIFNPFNPPAGSWQIVPNIRVSYQVLGRLVGFTESCVIVIASILGQTIYQSLWLAEVGAIDVATGVGLIAALVYLFLARSAELYRLPYILDPGRHIVKVAVVWAAGLLVLTAILFLLKIGADLSRGSFLIFSIFELPLIVGSRFIAAAAIKAKIARGAIAGRAAFVVGDASELRELSATNLLHRFGLKEVGRVALNPAETSGRDDGTCLLPLQEALTLARQSCAEEFVIAVGWNQTCLLAEISETLRNSPLPVRLLPDRVVRSVLGRRRADTSMSATITVEMQRAPMTIAERAAKRCADLFLASIALMILMPILAISAAAIKFESAGPVIFRQRRNGFNEREFGIYKFRTMQVMEDGREITQVKRGDTRVTAVGRLLRRASIDELPQLFNVLKGDMSLVGPRPHALAHDDQYKSLIATYCFRHHVKPGITGWAQVNGLRGQTTNLMQMQQRIEFDLWYINNWSFWLDIQILLRTCVEVWKHDAY
jgi:Undecaprenyl-phosphate glucose phosphotransferase